MTEAERALDESRKELAYLFCWLHNRCSDAEIICEDLANPYCKPERRNKSTRTIGGKIRDIENQVEKLKAEWARFLELKRKVKIQ